MAFSFPKKERLKSKKLIEQVFEEGKSIKRFPLKLIYLKTPLPEDVPCQVAMAVPKKKVRQAVKRNRIKRLMRESYRLQKGDTFNKTVGNFALLFLYLGKESPEYREIDSAMTVLLDKFLKETQDEKNDE